MEIPEEIMDGVTWETMHYPNEKKGGQHVASIPRGIKLTHSELGFSIFINYKRSQIENREVCLDLFKEFLIKQNIWKN